MSILLHQINNFLLPLFCDFSLRGLSCNWLRIWMCQLQKQRKIPSKYCTRTAFFANLRKILLANLIHFLQKIQVIFNKFLILKTPGKYPKFCAKIRPKLHQNLAQIYPKINPFFAPKNCSFLSQISSKIQLLIHSQNIRFVHIF